MTILHSSLLPCTTTTSPLSTRRPCDFQFLSFNFRSKIRPTSSFTLTSAYELKNPEPELSLSAQKTRFHRRTDETSVTEIGRVFDWLRGFSLGDCDFRQIHGLALKLNAFELDSLIGNKLVAFYSKNEDLLENARKVFDEIPRRTKAGYASLITAYCRLERWEEMFSLLGSMIGEGFSPDKYVLPTVLKAYSALKMSRDGKAIHGHVVRNRLDSDVFLGNSLVDLYANCGDLRSSRSVFDSMRERDVVSWTSLVTAYMDVGLVNEATEVFHSMRAEGLNPDLVCWNALTSGFARNGEIDLALRTLEEMRENGMRPRISSWNGIISGFVQNKYYDDALDVFDSMLRIREDPNFVTIASILPACAWLRDLNLGRAIHGFSLRRQLYKNTHVFGSLIDVYSKSGRNDYAKRVFEKAEEKNTAMWNGMIAAFVNNEEIDTALEILGSMRKDGPKPDMISFNTIIAFYARNGKKDEAFELMSEMVQLKIKPNIVSFNVLISGFQQSGLTYEALSLFREMSCPSVAEKPNSITSTSALAACAQLNSKRQGKEIHGYSLRNGSVHNTYVSSALVHMYSKCHDTTSASKVFWRIEERNVICWNALLAGHVNDAQPRLALELFIEMLSEGVEPSSITIMILLLACGDMVALRSGREIHGYVLKCRFNESEINVVNALIGMYAKCGSVTKAKSVFDREVKDDALWSTTVSACSIYGVSKTAIALFEQLELAGILGRHCC